MLKNSIHLLLFFFLFSLLSVHAQEKRNSIILKEILNEISIQHHVKFSYIEDEIVIFSILPPEKDFTLEQKIHYIEKETKLQFKRISENYFTLFNNSNLDKPLCGFLIDATTKLGIENARVYIEKSTFYTFSNSKGYFELPKVSANTIQIDHQSYQAFSINPMELNVLDCPTFIIEPKINALNEVITQPYLTKGIRKKIDGSIELKPKKFGLLPGLIEPDVLQTMQQIPGIISADETISNINVRGGTHDQNLFLWNGIRMFQTGHFFGLISAFNPLLNQTILITKNGSSAFFGESVSSLVIISSQNSLEDKQTSSFSSNFISAEFYKKINLSKNSSFTFSGRRSLTDFFSSPTYKNYSNRIFQNTVITNLNTNEIQNYKSDVKFYFYDISAQFHQKIGAKNEFFIDFITIDNNLKFNQSSTLISKESALKQNNIGASFDWKTNWNADNTTKLSSYISSYELNASNQTLESSQVLAQTNKVLDFGLKIQHQYAFSATLKLNTGYQFDEIGVTNFDEINLPFFSRDIKNVLISHAGIVESEWETRSKKTYLKTGLRLNYFEKFKVLLFEPRIQLAQSVSENLKLEILGEQKSQTLSQIIDLQQDFLGIEKRRWTLADNAEIPIQKSKQISVGLTYKKQNWLVSIDNFYKKITGITSSSQGFQNQFETVKVAGNYEVLGTEFLLQKTYKKFNTWLSYAFNKNTYDFKTLASSSFPNNFDITHAITWAGIYQFNTYKLALGAKWHSGRPITTPQSYFVSEINPSINYNAANNARLSNYFQMNFSASKEWNINPKTSFQIALSAINILDKKNSINRFYRVNSSNATVESVDIFSQAFTPNLSVKVLF